MTPKEIVVTYHYAEDDPEFDGDYHSIDVTVDGITVLALSDDYHDKSAYQVDGFLKALDFFKIPYNLLTRNVADSDL